MITVSASLSGATIDNNDLIRIITEEAEHRLILDGSSTESSLALIVKEKSARGICQESAKRKKCHNCKKPRNVIADCWASGGGKEGQGPKQKAGKGRASANAASANGSSRDSLQEEFTFVMALPQVSEGRLELPILPDSGASSHFCPDKS